VGRLFSVESLAWTDASGRSISRDVVRHPGAVLIIPVLDRERIVLIRNERVAVNETLWELPAGTLEAGEDPCRCAGRELEEETGYRAARIEAFGQFYTSPGFADELMHVFIGRDLEHVGQRLEPHEKIDVEVVTLQEVHAMIDDGRIRDGKTIAGVLMWGRREGSGATHSVGGSG
jgi:ADP-ribose pyrophosphatase